MKTYAVIGYYEDTGQVFSHRVEAPGAYESFAVVAKEFETAVLVTAVELPATIEYPGDSTIYAETILEQPDVFPCIGRLL